MNICGNSKNWLQFFLTHYQFTLCHIFCDFSSVSLSEYHLVNVVCTPNVPAHVRCKQPIILIVQVVQPFPGRARHTGKKPVNVNQ